MSAKFALKFILVISVIILISTLVVGSAVSAKERPLESAIFLDAPPQVDLHQIIPAPGGPGFISIMGGTFTPTDETIRWNVNAGELSNPDTENTGTYIAPVNLPQGAVVKQLVVFYNDLRTDNLSVDLRRKTIDQFFQNLASVSSQGTDGYGSSVNDTINVNFKKIDNLTYSYAVTAYIPKCCGVSYPDLYLVSVRIDYDYPVYIPTVQK